jgi:hypothetical protein
MASIKESIEGALEFIEASHGHKGGAVYEDLAEALTILTERHPKTMDYDPADLPTRGKR